MSCCGKQREQFLGTSQSPPRIDAKQRPPLHQPAIRFEYVGATGLTVVGPVTGKRYRFDHGGSQVMIDQRDAPAIAAVPHLRQT